MEYFNPPNVRARVWATRTRAAKRWTWHFEVRVGDRRVLYDNTGAWWPIYCAAAARVEAIRHLQRAHPGLEIPEYRG